MELLIGLGALFLLVLWGVWGHWQRWEAVRAAAVYRRWAEAQADGLWTALRQARAAPPAPQPNVWEAALDEIEGWPE